MSKLLIGREYPDAVIEAIKNSKVSVKIFMYDWRWYSHQPGARIQKLNQEIIKAVKRKVDVRVVLNNNSILRILKSNGIKAIVTNASRTMHAKIVIIDEKILFIGSHNFSINGFEINHEFSLKLDDQKIIDRCNTYFKNLWLS